MMTETSTEKSLIEKIFDNKVVLAVLLVMLCGPYMLTRDVKATRQIYEFLTTMTSWAVILLYARYGKLTVPVKWLAVFMGWTFITTFFISNNSYMFYKNLLPIAAIALLIELAVLYKGYNLLDAIVVFRIYIYVNLVMILLYPAGIMGPSSWFLGYRNIHAWFLLPLMTLLIIRALWKYHKLDKFTIIDIVAILFTILWIRSSTSWVGLFVYLVIAEIAWICYKGNKSMPRMINLFDGWLATLVFLGVIVIGKLQYMFEGIIVHLLHRDLTFTYRTEIWDRVLEYLKSHWLLGCGYLTKEEFKSLFPSPIGYNHPHNYMLSLMMQGGMLLVIIVIAGFLISGLVLWKHRNSVAANLMLAVLVSFLVMGLTEALSVYMCPLMYPMLTLSMHAKELECAIKKKESTVGV